MTPELQLFMVLGALVLLCIIFTLLKRGLMSVKYSLLWLLLAVALVIAAAFPYVIYVLRDILSIEMPVNLVFLLMFCFEHCHYPAGRKVQAADPGQRHFGKTRPRPGRKEPIRR